MNIKFLVTLMIVGNFTTNAYGSINFKLLDEEADSYSRRIYSGTLDSQEKIKQSLSFIKDENEFEKKYAQEINFEELYKKVNSNINNENFGRFSKECKIIFKNSDNICHKAAIYFLLDEVYNKFSKTLKLFEKTKKIENKENNGINEKEATAALNYFLNIDKYQERN